MQAKFNAPEKKLKFDFFEQFVIININLKSGEEL